MDPPLQPSSSPRPRKFLAKRELKLPVRRVGEIMRHSLLSLEMNRPHPPRSETVLLMAFCAEHFLKALVQDSLSQSDSSIPEACAPEARKQRKKATLEKRHIDAAVNSHRSYEFLRLGEGELEEEGAMEEGQEGDSYKEKLGQVKS